MVTNTYDYTSTQTPIPGSLRYELAIADSLSSATITFNLGRSSPVITLIGGPLVIDSNVTINALKSGSQYGGSSWMPGGGTACPTTGVTITQNGTATDETLFDITAGTVQVNGLTLLGGIATLVGSGGAVYDTDPSTVTFQNDVFTANADPGMIFNGGLGGAIFAQNGAVNVTCCCFNLNTASQGGAIAYGGNSLLTVSNSQFTQNTANDSNNVAGGAFGGAIFVATNVNGTQLSISGSCFSGNVAIGLVGNTFGPNGEGGYGGAIAVLSSATGLGTTVINGSTFNSNAAVGGAVQ